MRLLAELRRRNVLRMAGLYLVGAWLVVQVAETLLPIFGTPDWVLKTLVVLLALGFIPALVFSWLYELTPEGIKRDAEVTRAQSIAAQTGRRMDRVLIGALVLALAWFAFDKYKGTEGIKGATTESTGSNDPAAPLIPSVPFSAGSVAVLPFVALSSGPDDGYFADGLSEEIINALTALPDLLVTARTSAFHFKGKDTPIPEIARILGVEHVLEGSVRRAGDTVRITAQLIRAADGFHLWSQTYDRSLADVFAAQADIAENVASALGVLLDERKRAQMADAGVRDIEAFLAYMRGRELYERAHGDESTIPTLMLANREYEAALARKPDFAQAWLEHTDLYAHVLMDELATGDAAATSITGLSVAQAGQRLAAGLAAAVRHEKDVSMRRVAQVAQTVLSEDWTGLADQLDQVLAGRLACRQWLWLSTIALQSGYESLFRERALERTRCDPHSVQFWSAAADAEIQLGRPEAALAIVDRGQALLGVRPQLVDAQATALIALRRTDGLRVRFAGVPGEPLTLTDVKIAAAGTDLETARKVGTSFVATAPHLDRELAAAALVGDRQSANALAARIDASPLGAAILVRATYACTCGAPFDIAATPRFAQRMAEAGLPWPPRSPVAWPLKDW
jgi:TolB-like protein